MAGTESRSEAGPAALWARTAARAIDAGGRRFLGRMRGARAHAGGDPEMRRQLAAERARSARIEAITHLGTWEADIATGTVSWSAEAYRIMGLEPFDSTPTLVDVLEMVVAEEREVVRDQFVATAAGRGPGLWRCRVVRPDGEVRLIEAEATLTGGGRVSGFYHDVTDRQRVADELDREQALLARVEEIAHLGAWQIDLATRETLVSSGWHGILGVGADVSVSIEQALDRVHPDDQADALAWFGALSRSERPDRLRYRFIRPDGVVRWLEAQGELTADGRLLGFAQDVTEQCEAEQRRETDRKQLELAMEMARLGAWEVDVEAGTSSWSEAVFRIAGREPSTLALEVDEIYRFFHPDDLARIDELRQAIAAGEAPQATELRFVRPDGEVRWLRAEGRFVAPGHVVGFCQDITEQRRQQSALRESEERLRIIQENAPIGMALIGLDNRWVQINPAGAAMFGYEPGDLVGRPVAELIPPGDPRPPVEGRPDVLQTERRILGKDGRPVWVLANTSLMRDPEGRPQFYVSHIVDITDRKLDDERLRQQATEIERANQAKTEFLSRMSHELRTPLNAVLGYGQLLAMAGLDGHEREAVDQILRAGRHLLDLIDEVLDITGVEAGTLALNPELLDLGVVIADAVRLVQPTADAADITITVAEPGPDDTAYGDRRGTIQILLNLLSNAIKFNHPFGRVSVATRRLGDEVQVAVTDTGRGIPSESIPRVFEPFDRMGAEQLGIQGTGIGLPLARSLAEHMHGTLTVDSERGRGSTFTLTLPTGAAAAAALDVDAGREPGEEEPVPSSPLAGHDLTVVNIEDNPANQMLVRAVFRERPDIRLHTAATGADGIALIDEHHPDLVLLDLHLPDMHGTEILRHVTEIGGTPPTVAVLSADANPEQINTVIALGATHYLVKPLDIAALLRLVDSTVPAKDRHGD